MNSSTQVGSSQNTLLPDIPELFDADFLDVLIPRSNSPSASNARGQTGSSSTQDRTRTENGGPAYGSTGSATLDAFCSLGSHTYGPEVGQYLDQAWAEDPDLTLRIIWKPAKHPRRQVREGAILSGLWNLHLLVEPVYTKLKRRGGRAHGYWKDLLNILVLATVDQLSDVAEPSNFLHRVLPVCSRRPSRPQVPRRDAEEVARLQAGQQLAAKEARAARATEAHTRVERKLLDPKYRALYIAVARLFSARLLADMHLLHASAARPDLLRDISLTPKWAPTPGASHDRCNNIATAIARLLYSDNTMADLHPPSALAECASLESAEATGILRSYYQRWILTPLRAATAVPEALMSVNRWTDIPYSRVSAVCMQNNMPAFFDHDPAGFERYLVSVEGGTRSISGATLLPHQLLAQVVALSADCERGTTAARALAAVRLRVVEAQWRTLVQNLRDAGALEHALAVTRLVSASNLKPEFGNLIAAQRHDRKRLGFGISA
ncbi:hypothetical protein DFH09DRAFT_1274175 [Mycena vulgaris]|nr:hypothetical protein DFH09DRAFT_1274175 [Mycena vulgaris]